MANLIGGLIFFWVDRFIFTTDKLRSQWEVVENVQCKDCGRVSRGYRLVKTSNYDKTKAAPEFRCEACSVEKSSKLRAVGVVV